MVAPGLAWGFGGAGLAGPGDGVLWPNAAAGRQSQRAAIRIGLLREGLVTDDPRCCRHRVGSKFGAEPH
jgi:hypothetical protein